MKFLVIFLFFWLPLLLAESISIISTDGTNFTTNFMESTDVSASSANLIIDGDDGLFEHGVILSINGGFLQLTDSNSEFNVTVNNSDDIATFNMLLNSGGNSGLVAGDVEIDGFYQVLDGGILEYQYTISNNSGGNITGELFQYFDFDADGSGGDSVDLTAVNQIFQNDGTIEITLNSSTEFSQSETDDFADLRTKLDNALAVDTATTLDGGFPLNNQDVTLAFANYFDIADGESATFDFNVNGDTYTVPEPRTYLLLVLLSILWLFKTSRMNLNKISKASM